MVNCSPIPRPVNIYLPMERQKNSQVCVEESMFFPHRLGSLRLHRGFLELLCVKRVTFLLVLGLSRILNVITTLEILKNGTNKT